jgi:hypothetical protein
MAERISGTYIRVGRARTIKPEFSKHEALFDLEQSSGLPVRLAFACLWSHCDREGRFQWRPRSLKTDVMPFDEVDFSRVLHALGTGGFVVPYEINGEMFGFCPSWKRHQVINNREQASVIPAPTPQSIEEARKQLNLPLVIDASLTRELPVVVASATREPRVEQLSLTREPPVGHAGQGEGKGREGKGKDKTTGTLARAQRLPESFAVTDEHRAFAKKHGLPDADKNVEQFKDHWRSVAGQKGVKLNWDATFRNWLRIEAKMYSKGGLSNSNGNGKPKGTTPDADDLIRERREKRAAADAERNHAK